ncbi:methyltransferase family protein [Sphingosinicella sp.]|uniref:methyltransferase family protein n=1 Tax=Sphingosinicella sp. TaxID=1917971 RepID=UPI0040382C6F
MNAERKIAAATRHAVSRAVADPRPASAVSSGVGFAGLAGLAIWTAIAWAYGMRGPLAAMVALIACAVPMLAWSLIVDKVHRNPTTGVDWGGTPRPLSETLDISLAKIAGLWAIWAAIGALYCLCRWYWSGAYLFSMQVLGVASVPMLVLSIPYVIWLDRRMVEPKDGAWHFGQWLIGRSDLADRETIYEFLRQWTIKGFFLAFMISIVPGNWQAMIGSEWTWISAGPANLAGWLIAAMFMIDVVFATVGYALTMKPLDGHIRGANPYAAGWTAALICYPPFIMMGPGGPLDYHRGTHGDAGWAFWLADYPALLWIFGAWLVFLTAVYAWATVAFGFRFSNLTHRGILTHGPYAWTKHPAYVSKNLFWWFAVLPFLAATGNPVDMVRNSFVLAVVSGVYYWRARTEERHLMADPAYQDYAAWMARNAPLSRLTGWLRRRWDRPQEAVPAE